MRKKLSFSKIQVNSNWMKVRFKELLDREIIEALARSSEKFSASVVVLYATLHDLPSLTGKTKARKSLLLNTAVVRLSRKGLVKRVQAGVRFTERGVQELSDHKEEKINKRKTNEASR